MSQPTKIEWTAEVARQLGYAGGGHTWNPVRGCSRVSEGCRNCYAEAIAARFSGTWKHNPFVKDEASLFHGFAVMTDSGPRWTGKVELIEEKLEEPLKRRKPTVYFVNSMSDLFHEALPDDDIAEILGIILDAKQHLFLVLTKRSEQMSRVMKHLYGAWVGWEVIENLWLGVSVEDRKNLGRVESLRKTPATKRFLSLEPLLEDLGVLDLGGIDWVICGGESGPGARPMHPDWARSVRDQCQAAGVQFFFKQWGSHCPESQLPTPVYCKMFTGGGEARHSEDTTWHKVGKKSAGALLDGREWREVPK